MLRLAQHIASEYLKIKTGTENSKLETGNWKHARQIPPTKYNNHPINYLWN